MLFKFTPVLKQVLWGGSKIIPFKHLDVQMDNVGESWEVSGVAGHETVVAAGPYEGTPLNSLVALLGASLLGADNYRRFGNEFPLLVKFIDAAQDLSIQVHPNDAVARQQGRTRGKTEMWYIIASDGGTLYSGLRRALTAEQYAAMVADDTICDALAQYAVRPDDVFFLPAGRIHAIGAGCFLAEIQQTSDVTWRIYDFHRKDSNGNYRELHTQQAAAAIDYHVESDYRTEYRQRKNEGVSLVSCPYFTTAVYDLDLPLSLDYSALDSFVILIALAGEGVIYDSDGNKTSFVAGETLLVPATERVLRVEGTVKFLETYV